MELPVRIRLKGGGYPYNIRGTRRDPLYVEFSPIFQVFFRKSCNEFHLYTPPILPDHESSLTKKDRRSFQ